jgi:zinc protease
MKHLFLTIYLCIQFTFIVAQSFQTYTLSNGLTVYLWEDHNQPSVFGSVVVRAGSVDEPAEFTGLAHYLEHVLFKGTQKIGSIDWEKEKVHYNNIIQLYDAYAETNDQAKRAEIQKKINEESLEAAKFSSTNEFSNLVQSIGGDGLNAGTSYDNTLYYNNFPAFQLEKWLDLYAERFMNPVFRTFQAELENVFEEYNMYEDMNMTHIRKFLFSHLYAGHPYSREIIGTYEHLKNPRLSKLIEFYNTWYVPNNMALMLVGNFNSEDAIPLIEAKFSRLESKPLPERPAYPDADFSKNPRYTAKLGYSPMVMWAYKTVSITHEDEYLLDFCANLLTNSMQTGLLDKLTMDGEVQYAGASLDSRRDQGRFLIQAVPYYDVNQRLYESDKVTEKIIMQEVDKIKKGNIEDWLIESVKKSLLRQAELMLENAGSKAGMLQTLFVYELPDDYYKTLIDKIRKVTKEDIQRTANKYITGNHLTVSIETGKPKKNKLAKPDIKPIDQPQTKQSEYATVFKSIPVTPVQSVFNNFEDVKRVDLYNGVSLHYTPNPFNQYFTLTLRYGIGTVKMPKLAYAVKLINSAGIMPYDDAQTVRRQFSELDASCTFSVSDDYFYINLIGSEDKLEEICRLMTRLTLLPKLDEKQKERIIGSEISYRLMTEKKDANVLGSALLDYAVYKGKSDYIDRMSLMDIYGLQISELTGEIIRASDYELDIHYVGKKSFEEVSKLLGENLPLKEGVKTSESPLVKEQVTYDKPIIYFLPNKDVQQAQIYFYFDGMPYAIEQEVDYNAFIEYFSGSFNGLVMQEIREKNSMAYTASGRFNKPPIQGKNTYFLGYIGTQSDKVADAIDIYMDLLNDMPEYPDRIEDIKTYLKQAYLSGKPSFRNKSRVFDNWKKLGYTEDPAKVNMDKIESLQFDDIVQFYEHHVKDKNVAIVIMGDSKMIDTKRIQAKYGKITRLSSSTIFSQN